MEPNLSKDVSSNPDGILTYEDSLWGCLTGGAISVAQMGALNIVRTSHVDTMKTIERLSKSLRLIHVKYQIAIYLSLYLLIFCIVLMLIFIDYYSSILFAGKELFWYTSIENSFFINFLRKKFIVYNSQSNKIIKKLITKSWCHYQWDSPFWPWTFS